MLGHPAWLLSGDRACELVAGMVRASPTGAWRRGAEGAQQSQGSWTATEMHGRNARLPAWFPAPSEATPPPGPSLGPNPSTGTGGAGGRRTVRRCRGWASRGWVGLTWLPSSPRHTYLRIPPPQSQKSPEGLNLGVQMQNKKGQRMSREGGGDGNTNTARLLSGEGPLAPDHFCIGAASCPDSPAGTSPLGGFVLPSAKPGSSRYHPLELFWRLN